MTTRVLLVDDHRLMCEVLEFVVQSGDTASTIATRLEEEGLILDERAFVFLAVQRGLTGDLQQGSFLLRKNMPPNDVVTALLAPRFLPEALTAETHHGAAFGDPDRPLARRSRRVEWMIEGPGNIVEVDESGFYPGRGRKIDNTYAAGILLDAFATGVDVSMQALTKYVGGHSDLLLGAVSVRDEAAMKQVGKIYRLLGLAACDAFVSHAAAHRRLERLALLDWFLGRAKPLERGPFLDRESVDFGRVPSNAWARPEGLPG